MSPHPLAKELSEVMAIAAYLVAMMSLPAFGAVPARDYFFGTVGGKPLHEKAWAVFLRFWGLGVLAAVLFAVVVFLTAIVQKALVEPGPQSGVYVSVLFAFSVVLAAGFCLLVFSVLAYCIGAAAWYSGKDIYHRIQLRRAARQDPVLAGESVGGPQEEHTHEAGQVCSRSGLYYRINRSTQAVVAQVYVRRGDTFLGDAEHYFVYDRAVPGSN